MGWANVSELKIGKSIHLVVECADVAAAEAQVRAMCERILANPVIEAYDITVHELAAR